MSATAVLSSTSEAPQTSTRIGWSLVLILSVGALLRLALWMWFDGLPPRIVDETHYNQLAINLLQHREYAFEVGQPTSIRPPLYPYFLAGIYGVAGVENFQAVRLVQLLLSLLTIWLVYRMGREVYDERVGLLAAGLFAFYPGMIAYHNLLLTEVPFTLLLTASCYAIMLYFRRERMGWLALAGVLLGLAALTRSVVWMSPPFLAAYVLMSGGRSLAHRAVAALLMMLAFAATIGPWTVRNTRLQETFVTIDVMGGRNFMMGNYQHTPLYRSWAAIGLEGENAWYHEVFQAYPPQERATQGKLDKLALKQGLTFVRENPGLTALRDVIKFFDFWGLEREWAAGASQGFFGAVPRPVVVVGAVLIAAGYVAALFLGIFGSLFAAPADRRVHWLFLLVILFICGMHTLVFGHSRYHLPLIPLILLSAASAWVNREAIWANRRSLKFALGVVCCGVFALGWGWNLAAGDVGLLQRLIVAWF